MLILVNKKISSKNRILLDLFKIEKLAKIMVYVLRAKSLIFYILILFG